jgi:hypothetical protein
MLNADGRVGAQILARALLQEPLDRADLANLAREGTTEGLDWQLRSEPTDIKVALPSRTPKQTPPQPGANSAAATSVSPAAPANQWAAYRVIASVSWAPGQSVNVETVRLGKAE